MRRLVLIACLVLALALTAVLMLKPANALTRTPAQNASLLLLHGPQPSNAPFAQFCLTNGTRAHLACVPEAFEQMSAGRYVRTPLTGPSQTAVRSWVGVPEVLGPGQAQTFFVPPPTTAGVWRLVFMCQEQAPVTDPVLDTARHVVDPKARNSRLQQFSGRRYYLTSPDVAP